MAQRNRQRYSKKQAGIIEIESQKILDACKGDKIPSKHVSEWYHPPKYSYQSLTPNPDDDYLLSIFFWRPEKFYHHYVPIIPCIIDSCNGKVKSKGWADGGGRLIYGINRNVLLCSWSYTCDSCKISFYSHDDRLLRKLPEHIQHELVSEILSLIPDIGLDKVVQRIRENHIDYYLKKENRYYEHCIKYQNYLSACNCFDTVW
ncbi:9601_t:CDS:2 [Entrophospora sp. SA101]|nr:9601_t:CDS:2 [Entrophospora sp. SA101]CAJ0827812.1 7879_t:CDS:2 [Entrophospora sp. SA101]